MRFNLLGTLRLVALKDVAKLRIAQRRVEAMLHDETNWRSVGISGFLLFPYVLRRRSLYARIMKISNICPNSLAHRTNWSRYYSERFGVHLEDVKAIRIEGFEPYDEFVRRKLSSVFSTVESLVAMESALRDRYDRWVGSLSTDVQTVLTLVTALLALGALLFTAEDLISSVLGGARAELPGGNEASPRAISD